MPLIGTPAPPCFNVPHRWSYQSKRSRERTHLLEAEMHSRSAHRTIKSATRCCNTSTCTVACLVARHSRPTYHPTFAISPSLPSLPASVLYPRDVWPFALCRRCSTSPSRCSTFVSEFTSGMNPPPHSGSSRVRRAGKACTDPDTSPYAERPAGSDSGRALPPTGLRRAV